MNSMPHLFLLILLAALAGTGVVQSADLNILVIGSTHAYSEGGESGVVKEKAFSPAGIGTQLQKILQNDGALSGKVNVVTEDIYRNKSLHVKLGKPVVEGTFNFRCYSLAQYYMWPEGRADRLSNLRGKAGTAWDYIVIMADPYIMANMPGMFAEGINLLAKEILSGTAKPILLAQWPENSSSFSATDFNEVVYRVGNSIGLRVIPAGKAWASLSGQDTSSSHPTPHGAYLAASCIYSTLYDRNAKTSTHVYSDETTSNPIAAHALSVVKANRSAVQYKGIYDRVNPFQMKYVTARHIDYNHTGRSSENGIQKAFETSMRLGGVATYKRYGHPRSWPDGLSPVDLNYGRGNDNWEDQHDYHVDSKLYDRSYGYAIQDWWKPAQTTMLYGIDKRYGAGGRFMRGRYNDGTDLGIAYNMIRPGTRELGLPLDVRCIPLKLMWTRIHDVMPNLAVVPDGKHINWQLRNAIGSYMYSLLSGRCPLTVEPDPAKTSEWQKWFGRKVGYETAWRMSHLTARAPGFRVMPSNRSIVTISSKKTETMTVQFMFPPKSAVTVKVTSSDRSVGMVSPKKLIFTPTNYDTPQSVRIKGVTGAPASAPVNIQFSTVSDDEVYDGLSDTWTYTNKGS